MSFFFIQLKVYSKFSCDSFSFDLWLFRSVFFYYPSNICVFPRPFCSSYLIYFWCGQRTYFFCTVSNLLGSVLWPNIWSILENVPYALMRWYILLLLGVVCNGSLLDLLSLYCCSSLLFSCWFSAYLYPLLNEVLNFLLLLNCLFFLFSSVSFVSDILWLCC